MFAVCLFSLFAVVTELKGRMLSVYPCSQRLENGIDMEINDMKNYRVTSLYASTTNSSDVVLLKTAKTPLFRVPMF